MATTTIFLPGKAHGQRSLAGYSPWGCKELDTTEPLGNTNPSITVNLKKLVFLATLNTLQKNTMFQTNGTYQEKWAIGRSPRNTNHVFDQ